MTRPSRSALVLLASAALSGGARAQVPDLLNALDAGGRAMATGGANSVTNVDTLAAYNNPAALGYLDSRAVDLTFRNLPKSRTRLSGTLADPDADSSRGSRGGTGIGHLGFAIPVNQLFGKGQGTLAVAFTAGGFIDDHATATGLTDGIFTTTNYRLDREAKTNFYSLSYGRAASGGFAFGLGAVVATADVKVRESFGEVDAGGTVQPPTDLNNSSTGTGFGAIIGALYTPPANNAWTFGLSFRTPMDLTGNGETQGFYDEIPGRLLFGTTWRREGFRGGKDYLLLGAQVQSFVGGKSSRFFDRDGWQTGVGAGAEYNLGIASGRVPLRFGFATLPGGGDGYGSRNAFTFGFGYRPNRFPAGLDVSFAVPEKGGYDFGIGASYRFK